MPLDLALSILLLSTSQVAPPAETLIRMTVHPKAAPKPALRYLLLPEVREMTRGNPIQGYLQCYFDQDLGTERETLDKAALRQADRAARMDQPDWQLLPHLKEEGLYLLLPDVQKMRMLGGELQNRFRTEIAQGRMDDAIVTAKTMLALSRHMGEHPSLIGQLVGFAIAQIALMPLQEMLEHPDCPNLYWALTNLPQPFIVLDKGMEGERVMTASELRNLDDSKPMTPTQLKKLMERIDRFRIFDERPRRATTKEWVAARVAYPKHLESARQRLIEYGLPSERLNSFPAEQIILLDEKRELDVRRDEMAKLLPLPTWQFWDRFAALKIPKQDKDDSLFGPSLLSRYDRVRLAQGRLEQRIALLRHLEAIRLYAASHNGKLPATLTEISVPLPVDPFTGKPFRYELVGPVAHLRGSPPTGMESLTFYNLHYEITLAGR